MIYVTQSGRIAEGIYSALRETLGPGLVAQTGNSFMAGPDDLLVAAVDRYGLDELKYWEAFSRKWKTPFFCVHVHAGEAVIGPVIDHESPGCLDCWFTRYYCGRAKARKFAELASWSGRPAIPDPWLNPAASVIVAQITAVRVTEALALRRERRSNPRKAVYYLDLQSLTGQEWRFFPDSLCPECCNLPYDSAEQARPHLVSRPKSGPGADRARKLSEMHPDIAEFYVGRGGLVSGVSTAWKFSPGAVALTSVAMGNLDDLEPCSGLSDTYSAARSISVLEAIERYSSTYPRSYRVAIRATMESLGDLAVDPRKFGLHSEEQYKSYAELLTPYTDQLEMDFVWAYSFARNQSVLVPRHLGYYTPLRQRHEPIFVIEGSSGCAVGSCAEEAILHGLLEVIERDAFLLTWYARRKHRRIDLARLRDPEILCRLRLLEAQEFDVIALETTTDFRVPAVFLVARRRQAKAPYAVCTAAAHIDPLNAIRKAVRELTSMVNRFTLELSDPRLCRRATQLATNFSLVRNMPDHSLCYCAPEAGPFLDFLFAGEEYRTIEEAGVVSQDLHSNDLHIELSGIIDRILATGLDVIVVNQTSPEQLSAELCTYKALIPGAVPIAWGTHLQRFEGLTRLDAALQRDDGYKEASNSAPHPFP